MSVTTPTQSQSIGTQLDLDPSTTASVQHFLDVAWAVFGELPGRTSAKSTV
jgi:hypothetical protein